MSIRAFTFILLLLPVALYAQSPAPTQVTGSPNATTLAVLLANRPSHIEQAKWLEMMEKPVHRALYPMRITPTTLDTLDGSLLDRRFQYIMAR